MIKLFNTLTRKKEEFKPISPPKVGMYSCGPTVYSSASIGNMRAYVFADVLKRALRLAGYEVNHVMNITDVGHLVSDADDGEDKVEAAARKQGRTPMEIAKRYTDEFFQDTKRLNIEKPAVIAPATEYVKEMIEFISGLEKKGYIYVTDDGVYFDASKFPEYYKLNKSPPEGNRAGERVSMGQKKNENDFALWKFVSPNTIQKWESPWGVGCPGWHIECSAIARCNLGETFDIHTGGIDHIPTHHTNEIAQTESLTDKPMSNFFIHNEFMTVDGTKMSKSLGNVYTVTNLMERGYHPLALRYLFLQSVYRKQMNFTFDALAGAQTSLSNMTKMLEKHKASKTSKAKIEKHEKDFKSAMLDDMNTPKALSVIWDALKMEADLNIFNFASWAIETLGLNGFKIEEKEIPAEVVAIAERRVQAKKEKDFALADKLRDEIKAAGFEILDTKNGFEIR